MIDDNSIKANIFIKRSQRGITQKEMAEKLGMDRTTYRKIEKGDTRILGGRLTEIAGCLGISTEELVLGYIPSSGDVLTLQEYEAEFNKRVKVILKTYEEKINDLNKELSLLQDLNKELKERIKDKEEIIGFMKREAAKRNGFLEGSED